MTKQQLRKLQWLTNVIDRRHHDGRMSFRVEPSVAGKLIFVASNADSELRWFESYEFFIASIGPRGGMQTIRSVSNGNTIRI